MCCFDDRRRRRELICDCREVRSDRDFRDRNRNREVELRCRCREINRRESNRRSCDFFW